MAFGNRDNQRSNTRRTKDKYAERGAADTNPKSQMARKKKQDQASSGRNIA